MPLIIPWRKLTVLQESSIVDGHLVAVSGFPRVRALHVFGDVNLQGNMFSEHFEHGHAVSNSIGEQLMNWL